MIWDKLPKVTFVGADVLEFGAYDAVAHFNMGSGTAAKIIEELGLEPGHYFQAGTRKADEQRVAKAGHRANVVVKKQRKVLRGKKKKKEDKTKEKEGNTLEAGAF